MRRRRRKKNLRQLSSGDIENFFYRRTPPIILVEVKLKNARWRRNSMTIRTSIKKLNMTSQMQMAIRSAILPHFEDISKSCTDSKAVGFSAFFK